MKKRMKRPQKAGKRLPPFDKLFDPEFEGLIKKIYGKNGMTDKPLPWPYGAREARDRSAEEAQRIVNLLNELLDSSNDVEVIRRVAKALVSAHKILRHLEGQGAQTKPD